MQEQIPIQPVQQTAQPPAVLPNFGVVPPGDFEAKHQADNDAKAQELATGSAASSLVSYMNRCLNEAEFARQISGITDRLLDAQRRRRGEHTPEKVAQLKKYNLPNYWVPLTQTKCIHTEAWLRDILMPYADKIWKLAPSEEIELSEEEDAKISGQIMQEAKDYILQGGMVSDQEMQNVREKLIEKYKQAKFDAAKDAADNMESLIYDQHEECDFRAVFREFQSNLATYGTAFIKGPFIVKKRMPKWVNGKREVVDVLIPSCSAPSPHDIYPAPWAKNEQDGYIIERIKTYREGLSSCRGLQYYQTKEIEALLMEFQASASSTIKYGDYQRYTQEDRTLTPIDNRLECFQFSGPVPGYMLQEWGMPDRDPASEYNVEVLWSRNHILKVMPTWDDTGARPYYKSVFKVVPGSFWGVGAPHLMAASQDRANMMMISLLDNSNWGTGFIGWIDQTRLVNIDDVKEMHSKKWIATYSSPGQTGAPMGTLQIDLKVGELNALYERCLTDADNESGVPAYMYGSGSGGPAAGTYSGLATLMNAAARGIKDALLEIDQTIIKFVQRWADWNNQYSERKDIKGDVRVICSGATGLFVQEMMLDKMDNLIAQAAPFMNLTGPGFVLGMLRQKAHALRVDTRHLPSDRDIDAMQNAPDEDQPTPIKPSMSINVKWEMLTPQEKQAIMSEVGLATPEAPAASPEQSAIEAQVTPPVETTGTPSNIQGAPSSQAVAEANAQTKPITPISR